MQKLGVADYPHREKLEELWKSGMRAKGLLEYISENNLPPISATALARYGQRNWSTEEQTAEDPESLWAISDLISDVESSNLGRIERISVSKTGYSISIKPQIEDSASADIAALPRIPSKAPRSSSKRLSSVSGTSTHVVIPDTQIEPERPTEHLSWVSLWVNDNVTATDVKVVHLGDHWNMGSLSSYDKGKGSMEGRRYLADIESGNEAFALLDFPEKWDKHFLFGNHDSARVERAVGSDIQLEGLLTTDHMLTPGWERHGFLEPVELNGVWYSHYWYNPNTGRPYGGAANTRLSTIGHSFVMGHQQGLQWATRYVGAQQQFGLISGSCYLHQEDYKGPQGNDHWQGIVILHDVQDGSCESPQFVSMDMLCRYANGVSLEEYRKKAGI